jgi:hypothetical protein
MNYATKTKKDLIDIINYREKELNEFQSYYVNDESLIRSYKERQVVLIVLLLLTFTFNVLF